ncbi:MAG TPA: folylpolyglutamate synthase/dihydrofolate synthase family protein [Terriglobia bacterium]|nr:folylpolyglutamate synthase/dihydrofolate synthase family protein [Terriglobia bacterium]
MNYAECLAYLADLGHELRGVKFGLEPIQAVLEALDHPERVYATAIVAGTNGKGSTSAILASILERAGYRTGLYTSPHLIRVNERIRVNGREVSDEDFARSFGEVRQAIDRLLEAKSLEHRPSFFEYLTATAFLHFSRSRVDFAVLEVGMGGRLDATNVTEPRVAVITNVDLDHMEFLGSTHAAIAGEKAGVIKPRRPVVSACEHPDAAEVVRRRALELGAELLELPRFATVSNVASVDGRATFDLALNGHRFSGLETPLRGAFQVKNAMAALTAACRLAGDGFDISTPAMVEGLRQASWPGRLEVIGERPLVVVDGAHNPAAAREVATFIRKHWAGRRLRLIYASMRDKAIGEISEILFPLADEVYFTRPPIERAATPEEILAVTRYRPPHTVVEPDPVQALTLAREASSPDDVVLACGSLFLVGALLRAMTSGQ